jgi:hypothetical protein
MMKVEINIKKRHLFLLVLFGVLLAFVYAQTAPNPGHSYSQIDGVAPNCVQASCPELPGSWGAEAVTSRYAARAYTSDVSLNSNQLGGLAPTSYCRSDGTNCPAQTIYSIASNQPCPAGTNALICVISPGGITGFNQFNSYQPYWSGSVWRASTSGSSTCNRVICG